MRFDFYILSAENVQEEHVTVSVICESFSMVPHSVLVEWMDDFEQEREWSGKDS